MVIIIWILRDVSYIQFARNISCNEAIQMNRTLPVVQCRRYLGFEKHNWKLCEYSRVFCKPEFMTSKEVINSMWINKWHTWQETTTISSSLVTITLFNFCETHLNLLCDILKLPLRWKNVINSIWIDDIHNKIKQQQ